MVWRTVEGRTVAGNRERWRGKESNGETVTSFAKVLEKFSCKGVWEASRGACGNALARGADLVGPGRRGGANGKTRPARTFMGVDSARSFLSFCSLSLSRWCARALPFVLSPTTPPLLPLFHSLSPPHYLCLFSTSLPLSYTDEAPPGALWIKFDLVSGRGGHPSVDPFLPPAHTVQFSVVCIAVKYRGVE